MGSIFSRASHYRLVHRALREAVAAGDTDPTRAHLQGYGSPKKVDKLFYSFPPFCSVIKLNCPANILLIYYVNSGTFLPSAPATPLTSKAFLGPPWTGSSPSPPRRWWGEPRSTKRRWTQGTWRKKKQTRVEGCFSSPVFPPKCHIWAHFTGPAFTFFIFLKIKLSILINCLATFFSIYLGNHQIQHCFHISQLSIEAINMKME